MRRLTPEEQRELDRTRAALAEWAEPAANQPQRIAAISTAAAAAGKPDRETAAAADAGTAEGPLVIRSADPARPATLTGIDTKFSFSGSKLVIFENQLNHLTLSGGGAV